jgi:hypothetical protein
MTTTLVTFALTLACGHSKVVARMLDGGAMPSRDAMVNCHGCADDPDGGQLVMARVAAVELLGAGRA